ncbi:MAG: NUDIX domain-containing protein [Bacteriovoracaceae bacterium]|nr:NUDIX domain-containing protein [Bacteriovoracaceae bacterium]
MKKLILLSGTLGVGKSTTAKELVELIDNCKHIEVDDFSNFEGFDVHNEEHLDLVITKGVEASLNSLKGNSSVVVLDYVIGKQRELDLIKGLLPKDVDFTFTFLGSENFALKDRIKKRNRDCVEWELTRTDTIINIQNDNLDQSEINLLVDTTSLSPKEVAFEVAVDFFRENTAAFVENSKGLLLFCHRRDSNDPESGFQVPQGGVEEGESLEQAITRELEEETGLRNFKFVSGPTGGIKYTWEKGSRKNYFVGQSQHYFHLKVEDTFLDEIIPTEDFNYYKWVTAEVMVKEVVDFKKPVYIKALTELGLL